MIRPCGFASLLALAALTVTPAATRADWPSTGVPVYSPSTAIDVYDPGWASDGAGGLYLIAVSGRALTPLRHLDASGAEAAGWPAGGMTLISLGTGLRLPRLAADGSGGVFAAYLSTGCAVHCGSLEPGNVIVDHVDASGLRPAGWTASGVMTVSSAYTGKGLTRDQPLLASDAHGGVFAAWTRQEYGPTDYLPMKVAVQRVTAAGVRAWSQALEGLEVGPVAEAVQTTPAMVPDASGGVWVAWADVRYGSDLPRVMLQHVSADGALATPAGMRVDPGVAAQQFPNLIGDGAGGVFVAWFDSTGDGLLELRAQHVGANLVPSWHNVVIVSDIPGPIPTYSAPVPPPGLALDGAGGVFVTWSDARTGLGRVFATRLDASGAVPAPWPADGAPVDSDRGEQMMPTAESDGSGGVYLAWRRGFARVTHLGANGERAAGWPDDGVPMCRDGGAGICAPEYEDPRYLGLVADGSGGVACVWQEWRSDPYPPEAELVRSFVQHAGDDAVVPVLASRVSAAFEDGAVRLHWQSDLREPLRVARTGGGSGDAWSELAERMPDARGDLVVTDADVRAGERYGYRLTRSGDGASLDEVWIAIPLQGALRVDGARPSPVLGDIQLAFALRDDTPATIELFDAAGRRLLSRRVDAPRPGDQLQALRGTAAFPSGVYLVRLTQGARTVATRVCVVH